MIDSVFPVGSVVMKKTPTSLSMNGGQVQSGDLGPTKLADVEVQSEGGGNVTLYFGQVVRPALAVEDMEPMTIIGVPEPSFGMLLVAGAIGLTGMGARRRGPRRTDPLQAAGRARSKLTRRS